MYTTPKNHERLLNDLKKDLGDYARLLLDVEIGFALLRILRLEDEPIVVLWVILSGTPVRHSRLQNLTDKQKRALANARILLPGFAGRFGWEAALRDYIEYIPYDQRRYDFDARHLEQQIIAAADSNIRHPARESVYEECLSEGLPYKERNMRYTEEGRYEFVAYTSANIPHSVTVDLSSEDVTSAQVNVPWFNLPRPRHSLEVCVSDLSEVAAYLDLRDGSKNWTERHKKIRYRALDAQGVLGDVNGQPIRLDGMSHIVGMVGAYKSTLMTLLAAYVIWQHRVRGEPQERRITLVVGDTLTAIQLANQFNQWFCDNPELDTPVAVPLMGRTTRDIHLQRFYASRDYQTHLGENRSHWGERWLNTACPLQATLSLEQLQHKPITPGREPCASLTKVATGKKPGYRLTYMCPFFSICPSQQMYRDMSAAQIWITTPGAIGAASLPPQLEKRSIKLGELVYEQSDLVIFDEVDTLIEWFDRLYAEEVLLAAGGEGILDDLDLRTTAYWTQNRIAPPPTSRWIGAQRHSLTAVSQLLSLLDETQGHEVLRQWVSRGYFTALNLFYRLARRLTGLKDYEDETDPSIIAEHDRAIRSIMSVFDELMNSDPLAFDEENVHPAAFELAEIMKDLMTVGSSAQNPAIIYSCKNWILRIIPDIQERLDTLQNQLSQSDKKSDSKYDVDTMETLAYRLEFALNAILLDRHTRIVFYEWHNRPVEAIDRDQPYNHIPSGLMNILPVPPTGRLFGTYYSRNLRAPEDEQQQHNNRLSTFGYTNIGRSYVRFFHNLRMDLDGQPGPNVLALSGTSYLPDSSRWHFDARPQGILEPEESSVQAIEQSQFIFLPLYNADGEAIRVSGLPNKMLPIKQLIAALVGQYTDKGGYLGIELQRLEALEREQADHWTDRARLLLIVNSYEQARWTADEIRARWPEMQDKVFNLTQSSDNESDTIDFAGSLGRADAESFARTKGKILIAPMLSIGRGLNILNSQNKAAFGAIYFLTRPMPHPYDTQSIAQELNRYTYDWYNDPDNDVWKADGIYQRGLALRKKANEYWRTVEMRDFYANLSPEERRDLAATTAGHIIQSVGRLVRGGVPFHAFFVDAAWAPYSANQQSKRLDTPKTSLLAAIIEVLADYVQDAVGHSLYQPLFKALEFTENFDWQPEPSKEIQ